jgi:hypothetical protein
MRKTLVALIVACCLATTACTTNVRAPIPGAVNQFDSDTYLSLVTAKGVIDQTKADLAAGSFPVNITPIVKQSVNDAVQAYNVADTAYQAYHAEALAGSATVAQQNAVSQKVSDLNTAVSKVTAAKAGK